MKKSNAIPLIIVAIVCFFIGFVIGKNQTPQVETNLVGTYQYEMSSGSKDNVVILDKENAMYGSNKAKYKLINNNTQIEITFQSNSLEGEEVKHTFNIVPNGLMKDGTNWLFKKI